MSKQKQEDYIGKKFNRLTMSSIYMKQYKTQRNKHAICICECGQKCDIILRSLKTGHTKSCGCFHKEKFAERMSEMIHRHGKYNHSLYRVWHDIIQRCTNSKDKSYHNYGGRGITVCKEWIGFINFYHWAIKIWKKGLQIDRIDNNGNYYPKNCRFVTRKVNSRNKRNTIFLTYFNETKTMIEWSEDKRCKVCYRTLYNRVSNLNWDIKTALTTLPKGSTK